VPHSRRVFIRNSGIGLLSFYVGGCEIELSPEEARQQDLPFQVLNPGEVRTLEAFGELLLPGSAAAGLAHFIDHQLNASPQDQLLMIKYLGVSAPFAPFYSAGLAALNSAANNKFAAAFADLEQQQSSELAEQIAQANPEGWDGPPAPFFYFVVRNDALDVVYGTKAGFERLGIPYMAHIEPPSRWGE
jgi:gluconate 2-dehydrogenase subunit 3-like protein